MENLEEEKRKQNFFKTNGVIKKLKIWYCLFS